MNTIINNIPQSIQSNSTASKPLLSPGEAQANFAQVLKSSLANMNHLEAISDEKTIALVNGEIEDLHEVMIAAQKASITVETTVQVQKRMIDAYNEIMRMQV